jgi:Raf kinase inhibitor-like YbhB/YbcL family protein
MQTNFKLYSKEFKDGASIPKKFTADGENVNPPLNWENPPEGTKSFSLIVEDPDAPNGTWIHWILKNIPSNVNYIERNSNVGEELLNSWQKKGWGGPSPPSGTHRYYFKLFALNTDFMRSNNLKDFYKEVNKHTIASATLMGIYSRE